MKSELIPCPHCGQSIDSQTWFCEFCGESLALAALLAKGDLSVPFGGSQLPIAPEILVPRLGEYLQEKGILHASDLQKALEYQQKLSEQGESRLIGQTLLDLDLVKKEQLDQAITEQILQLQSALQQVNVELEERVRERTAELENALNRLTELNQLKSNFIANISHELRTPLTHIKGYVELLLERELGPLTPQQASALDVMNASEERLERLIEDLIQFSLLARGDLDLRIEVFDLGEVLAEVTAQAVKKCKKKSLSFSYQPPTSVLKVRADQKKINWVLDQLFDNAIKFTPMGGEVGLKIIPGLKRVILSVYDSGIGIAPERFDEIFQTFHQLDGSARRRYGGTGLGLAMAHQIVAAHGSEIRVKSSLGEGATFEFSLLYAVPDEDLES
ncbi:MAG: HAMP domain-containing histidine kinase [Anaerolineales bacterium]|nr:HAMP domain-containing histidine kinase [Anaerolineales bacterium]